MCILLLCCSSHFPKDEERQRQEKLASERLEAARNGKKGKGGADEDIDTSLVDTEDSASLQDAIACDMDRRHREERKIFMKVKFNNLLNKFTHIH